MTRTPHLQAADSASRLPRAAVSFLLARCLVISSLELQQLMKCFQNQSRGSPQWKQARGSLDFCCRSRSGPAQRPYRALPGCPVCCQSHARHLVYPSICHLNSKTRGNVSGLRLQGRPLRLTSRCPMAPPTQHGQSLILLPKQFNGL